MSGPGGPLDFSDQHSSHSQSSQGSSDEDGADDDDDNDDEGFDDAREVTLAGGCVSGREGKASVRRPKQTFSKTFSF